MEDNNCTYQLCMTPKYKQAAEAKVRRCEDGGVRTYTGVVVRPPTLQ